MERSLTLYSKQKYNNLFESSLRDQIYNPIKTEGVDGYNREY